MAFIGSLTENKNNQKEEDSLEYKSNILSKMVGWRKWNTGRTKSEIHTNIFLLH